MTRRLTALNLLLAAAIGLIVWQTRQHWIAEDAHERAVLGRKAPSVALAPLVPLPKTGTLTPANYAEVAQKNLFSRDRNATVIYDPPPPPPPPKPMPPLPVARGVMLWDGAPPTVVLSLKGTNTQKGYHPGDTIGEFKVVSVDHQFITFNWDGKEIKKRLDEIMDTTPLVMETAQNTAPAAPAPAPAATNLGASKNGQGADMGAGIKACVPGDKSPAGAVVDGLKKIVSQTPFGTVCRWEPTS